jgi:murein DD-endopeptidase MepM/ murein hydrolase activator NlpD
MSREFRRYLRLDSPMLRGDDVLAVQVKLGLPEAQRDGVFGLITQRAVIAFQRKNQLKPDGIVGPDTWRALFEAGSGAPAAEHKPEQPGSLVEKILPELEKPHRRYRDSVEWRLTAKGLQVDDNPVETTRGKPETVRRICSDYREAIEDAARTTGVPVELLIATMCTESHSETMHHVNPLATRKEPGYVSDEATPQRVSYGLMQTLVSTARHAMSLSKTGSFISAAGIDREWLFVPANSILAGAEYIASQAIQTRLDPPLVACAYNAGGLYYNGSARNRWKMRQYPIGTDAHANRFVQWFNDCFRLFQEEGCPFDAATTFWHHLQDRSAPREQESPQEGVAQPVFIFPFAERPALDYKSGGRQFGASRSSGTRKHAGCDLKAPKGTEILSMANGEIIRGPAYFYEGTYALEVKHENDMVVRYGEISAHVPQEIKAGAKVSKGQVIALVGQLHSGNSMLHLEMYSGKGTGPLTQTGTPFKRRADLIDPTLYLDQAPLFDLPGPATEPKAEPIPFVDSSEGSRTRERSHWERALMDATTTGASDETAAQDHLSGGIDASHKMAKADWPRVKELAKLFQAAGAKFGIPGAVLAALASRESRCGAPRILDEDGWGDHRNAFGIMQIDRRHHKLEGPANPRGIEHIEQAAGIFCENLERVAETHPDWEAPFVLQGAVSAYNFGAGNVKTKTGMDVGTTGDDFGADVIARAQYYYEKEDAGELNA